MLQHLTHLGKAGPAEGTSMFLYGEVLVLRHSKVQDSPLCFPTWNATLCVPHTVMPLPLGHKCASFPNILTKGVMIIF